MAEKIAYIPQQPIVPITEQRRIAGRGRKAPPHSEEAASVSFRNLLDKQISDQQRIKFSAHAQQRLHMRNIEVSSEQLDRITDAVDRAAEKGARDSLLLVDNIAAVVSVENRTIITVSHGNALRENVFTNIDSAVIA